MTRRTRPVWHHVTASREAREFADRALARARKGDAYPPDVWVAAYLRQYRRLTGRPLRSGPMPSWGSNSKPVAR